jgi:hypothetical protein
MASYDTKVNDLPGRNIGEGQPEMAACWGTATGCVSMKARAKKVIGDITPSW